MNCSGIRNGLQVVGKFTWWAVIFSPAEVGHSKH